MRRIAVALGAAVCAAVVPAFALAGDLKVFSTPTVRAVLESLRGPLEREAGKQLVVTYDPVGALKRRIEAGEPFDVAILVPATVDELITAGKLERGTRTVIARAGYGVAVKAGSAKPDVSSVDAVKKVISNAQSLAYSPDSNSSAYFLALIDRLQLDPAVKTRLKPVAGARVVEAVGSGEAELTIITVPNIVGDRGVELAGLLPVELQNYSVFVGAISTSSTEPQAARALLAALMGPEASAAIRAAGLERSPD